ncbi:hypothetical protein AVEN_268129-1, partial [Araneus ventricosus]
MGEGGPQRHGAQKTARNNDDLVALCYARLGHIDWFTLWWWPQMMMGSSQESGLVHGW